MRRGGALVVALSSLVACTRPGKPPAETLLVGPAGGPAPAARPASCTTRDVRVSLDVSVAPPGVAPFVVRVHDDGARVLVAPDEELEVTFEGPVALRGVVRLLPDDSLAPWWMLGAPGSAGGGLVAWSGVRGLDVLAVRGDTAEVALHVLGDDRIAGLVVPCASIAVGRGRALGEEAIPRPADALFARSGRARVCAETPEAPCVEVSAGVPLEEVSRHAGVVSVRARFANMELRGVVREGEVERRPVPTPLSALASGGGCGCGGSSAGRHPQDPRAHHGPARLRAGTVVYATADLRGAWARLTAEVTARIDLDAESEVATVGTLPGVSSTPRCDCQGLWDVAFVRRADLIL